MMNHATHVPSFADVLAKGSGWELYYTRSNLLVSPLPSGLGVYDVIDLLEEANAIRFFTVDDFGNAVEVDGFAYQQDQNPTLWDGEVHCLLCH